MRGETPGVKVCHRMEAAKHLIKYGFTDADCETTSDRLSRAGGNPVGEVQGEGTNTPSPSTGEGWDGGEDSPHIHVSPRNPPRHPQLPDSPPHPPRDRRRPHPRRVSHSHHDRQGQAIHPQEVPHKASRPHGSSKRTPAPWLRRPRITPQAFRHHRRSKRLRHPAHRPRHANARVQRARHRHRPLPAGSDVRPRP